MRKEKKTHMAQDKCMRRKMGEMRSQNWLGITKNVGQEVDRSPRILLAMTRASDVIPSEPRSH